jgi:hypothetical protein
MIDIGMMGGERGEGEKGKRIYEMRKGKENKRV